VTLFRSRMRAPKVVVEDTLVRAELPDLSTGEVLEIRARSTQAAWLVENALAAESVHWPEDRNGPLIDLCLELRNILNPAPVSARVPVPGRS
jgi:hypothetical protein